MGWKAGEGAAEMFSEAFSSIIKSLNGIKLFSTQTIHPRGGSFVCLLPHGRVSRASCLGDDYRASEERAATMTPSVDTNMKNCRRQDADEP